MKIIATFANRTHEPDAVELVCAWDEYSIDANYEGWVEDKQKQLGSWGNELLNSVDVEIEIDVTEIWKRLDPANVLQVSVESQQILEEK